MSSEDRSLRGPLSRTGGAANRVVPVLAVAGLLAGAAAAAAFSQVRLGTVARDWGLDPPDPAPPSPRTAASGGVSQPATDAAGSWWLLVVGPVLALVLGAVLVAVVRQLRHRTTRRRRRLAGRPVPPPSPADEAHLAAAVDAGLGELAAGGDPRSAVIACWMRLEEAAAEAGVPRRPADTVADLVLRLLRYHRVSEPVLTELAAVYRLARYAPHEVDGATYERARVALRQVRDGLRGAVVGGRS